MTGANQLANFADQLVKVEQADTDTARTRRREQAKGIVKLFVSSPLPTVCSKIMRLACANT